MSEACSLRMESNLVENRIEGKTSWVPSSEIEGRTIIVTGKWVKRAAVRDEELVEGDSVKDPRATIARLKTGPLRADIFTFAQHMTRTTPEHDYYFEFDNFAALPTTTYEEWWRKTISHKVRGDVSRARKRGVVVKMVDFSDDLVRGIMGIYKETPVRQGRRFWHYAKDFETIKAEKATYLERSEFLGAYFEDELIGYMKITHEGSRARMLHILSKIAHQDKRPMNALIAKAVELCELRKSTHLIYGKYTYTRSESSLAEFKRRNGFQEIKVPRYYAPLTIKGRIAVSMRLHRGVRAFLPDKLISLIVDLRSKYFQKVGSGLNSSKSPSDQEEQTV